MSRMSDMDIDRQAPVPLRVVPPPVVAMTPGTNAPKGTTDRAALLEPLTMRERVLVCAVADALTAFQERAAPLAATLISTPTPFSDAERQSLLMLLVAFKDATGCAWTDAVWG